MQSKLPTIADIEDAAGRLRDLAVLTPLLEHPALNDAVGGRVLLKAENLQRVGAFKFRGAYNAISRVDRAAFPGGVVACSSGNHAQGVAHAASLCGLASVVVMPADSPRLKIERTRAFGAEVVTYDRVKEDREAIARAICDERKAAFIHPFDDPFVIAGQGTAGLELMHQAAAIGATPAAVAICCSGGGFASGVAIAARAASPAIDVFTVEPAGFDDMARSLVSGRAESNARASGSICDALLAQTPGRNTLAILTGVQARGLVVSDDDARQAVRFAFRELKLVLEPGGAVALAAILTGRLPAKGHTVAAVLSGGNVDPALFSEIICG